MQKVTLFKGWADMPVNDERAWQGIGEPPKDSELYGKVAAVYRAAQLSAQAASSVPFAIVKGDKDLDTSDEWQNEVGFMPDPKELIRLWRISGFMTNTCYGFMESVRGQKNLRYIAPNTMSVEALVDGTLKFNRTIGSGTTPHKPMPKGPLWYAFRLDYDTELLPSANTEFRAANQAAGIVYWSDLWTQHYFKRGAVKPALLGIKGNIQPAERERMENIFDKIYRNVYSWAIKAINSEHMEVIPLGDGLGDLGDTPVYRQALENIAMASGMPLSLLLANSANYATASAEYASWYRDGVVPWCDFIAGSLNRLLFEPMDMRFEFRPDEGQPDKEEEVAKASAAQTLSTILLQGNYEQDVIKVAFETVGIEVPAWFKWTKAKEPEPSETPVAETPVEETTEEETETDMDEESEEVADDMAATQSLTLDQFKELDLWRQFALRKHKRGQSVIFPFETKSLPAIVADTVRANLERATDAESIKAAFDVTYTTTVTPKVEYTQDDSALLELAKALNKAVEAVSMPKPQPVNVTVNLPGQSVTVSPEVKAPDVTVQSAIPSVIVNTPEQSAPVVNIVNDVQPAAVSVVNQVETPEVNVTVQPATVEIVPPKVAKVKRDKKGQISEMEIE